MTGDGEQRPGVEASLNLANNSSQLLEREEESPHDLLKVLFHRLYGTLPESSKVRSSGRDVVPGDSMMFQKIMLDGRFVLLLVKMLVELVQLVLGPSKVRAIVTVGQFLLDAKRLKPARNADVVWS